jgi:F-type H+-transporting ATPase subunit gamma
MATLREIRSRISGVKNTQKITKAMKMVSAAKLRRAQDAVIAARPYARKMKELLQRLAGVVDVTAHPLFAIRPPEKVALIVVSSDRGLCGAFNSNILKTGAAYVGDHKHRSKEEGAVHLIAVGKKGFDYFSKNGYKIANQYIGVFANLDFSIAQSIVAEVVRGFQDGVYDRVDVVYNEFKSIIQQRIVTEQLLPIIPPPEISGKEQPSQIDYIYEPSSAAIISELVPKHLNFQMWRILLESNAAEHGARMTAMDNATTNANDLIRDLQLSYNKTRQASITKELLEIVSGAEALKSSI